jgi:hypothetical protein
MKKSVYALITLFTIIGMSTVPVFSQEELQQVTPSQESQEAEPQDAIEENPLDLADSLIQEYSQMAGELELKNRECQAIEEQINQSQFAKGVAPFFGAIWQGAHGGQYTAADQLYDSQNYNSQIQNLHTMLSTCRNEKSILDLKLTLLKTQGQQIPGFLSKLHALQANNQTKATQQPNGAAQASTDVATITIERNIPDMSLYRSYKVFIDGEAVGKIKAGEKLSFNVPPGPHEVYAKIDWVKSDVVNMNIKPAGKLALKCYGTPFSFVNLKVESASE